MPTYEQSEELAKSIVAVANGAGCRTTALLTDMNQVLATSAGNAVEVREAVRYLTGEYRHPRLHEVTMALCAEMLISGGLASDEAQARQKLQQVLDNGKAAETFARMVFALGGPADFVENYDNHLQKAEIMRPVYAQSSGIVTGMDTRAIGMAVVALGGGRLRAADLIDHAVGLTDVISLGAQADKDVPLAWVHARTEAQYEQTAAVIRNAIQVGDNAVTPSPAVYRRITLADV